MLPKALEDAQFILGASFGAFRDVILAYDLLASRNLATTHGLTPDTLGDKVTPTIHSVWLCCFGLYATSRRIRHNNVVSVESSAEGARRWLDSRLPWRVPFCHELYPGRDVVNMPLNCLGNMIPRLCLSRRWPKSNDWCLLVTSDVEYVRLDMSINMILCQQQILSFVHGGIELNPLWFC
jgi:hypothetical protein